MQTSTSSGRQRRVTPAPQLKFKPPIRRHFQKTPANRLNNQQQPDRRHKVKPARAFARVRVRKTDDSKKRKKEKNKYRGMCDATERGSDRRVEAG